MLTVHGRATAFIFDTRTDVLVKVSKFLRQKMSRPEADSNPQPSDSCRMLYLFELSGPDICCAMFLNTGSDTVVLPVGTLHALEWFYSYHNTFVFSLRCPSMHGLFVSWGTTGWRFVINSRASIHVTIDCSTVLPLVFGIVTRQQLQINGCVVLGADESPWPCGTPSWYTPLSWMILHKQKTFSKMSVCLPVCLSVCLSVCLPVCLSACLSVARIFIMFPSPYHHEIFSFYYHWQKWCPCKRSRSEVKCQGHRGLDKFLPDLGVSRPSLHFELTDGYEMMHKAWGDIEEVSNYFWRSSITFQGHKAEMNIHYCNVTWL